MDERRNLEAAIEGLNAQRAFLGDEAVEAAIAAVKARLELISRKQAQRKYATVLFADVAGFTSMSESLDPEEVRDAMNEAWRLLDAAIIDHGGIVDKHIGDALMAVFGVPTAHEDDAERAVRAALTMQKALEGQGCSHSLSIRVGIHTGLLAWGSVGSIGEQTAMGDTVNLASRLEQAAPKGGVLISHEVYQQVRGLFDLAQLPQILVKGKTEPIRVYEVRGERPRARRPMVHEVGGVELPFLGREDELRVLREDFQAVNSGMARLRVVLGHAGQGKSGLVSAFSDWLEMAVEQPRVFIARADSNCRNRPFGLIRDLFVSSFGIIESAPLPLQREKLLLGLQEVMGDDARVVAPFIANAIGISEPDDPCLTGLVNDIDKLRAITLESMIRFFETATSKASAAVVLEDVHSADSLSVEIIDLVMERCRERGLFVLASGRYALEDTCPKWCEDGDRIRVLRLGALSSEACVDLVERVVTRIGSETGSVPSGLAAQIASAAAGNPFYLQEILRLIIEQGLLERDWDCDEVPLPGTVKAAFQARFDMLSDFERTLLRRAAVIGDQFTTESLGALGEEGEPDSHPVLTALAAREYIKLSGAGGRGVSHSFGHTLVRQFAYETISLAERRVLHERMARWLIDSPQARRDKAAEIAGHLALAGAEIEAGSWYLRAGGRSFEVGAVAAGAELLERGLDLGGEGLSLDERRNALLLLTRMLRRGGRASLALEAGRKLLGLSIGDPVSAAQAHLRLAFLFLDGGKTDEAERALASAGASSRHAHVPDLEGEIAYARAWLAQNRRDFEGSLRVCAEGLGIEGISHANRVKLRYEYGWILYRMGRLAESASLLEETRREADMAGVVVDARRARWALTVVLLAMGRPQEARDESVLLLEETRSSGDRMLEASVLNSLGECNRLAGDPASARQWYGQALELFQRRQSRDADTVRVNLANCDIQSREYRDALFWLDSFEPQPWLRLTCLVARLACAAGLNEKKAFDAILAEIAVATEETRSSDSDDADLLEHAGDRMMERGDERRAGAAYALSLEHWKSLDRLDDASRVNAKLVAKN